ncbi:MAG: Ig-like domain-containing protein [Ferruginibacter sp.]
MKSNILLLNLLIIVPLFGITQVPGKNLLQQSLLQKSKTINLPAEINENWYQQALTNIQNSEYRINPVLNSNANYKAANKNNKAAFVFNTGGYQVTNILQDNNLYNFSISGVGRNHIQWTTACFSHAYRENNTLVYNYGNFKAEYINDEGGMRQNFVIQNRPAGNDGDLSVEIALDHALKAKLNNNTQLQLNNKEGKDKVKILYDDLKAWDANHQVLAAHMELENNSHTLALVVDDKNAVYPVTIDPLNHIPEWTTSADAVLPGLLINLQLQVDALYGYNVAGLGDVNGDGFDDIAIGAPGAIDVIGATTIVGAGAVFVYFGSATGPSTTPDKVLRATTPVANASFGFSVAGGNVTGDGRNDIIVGAPFESYTANVAGSPSTATVTAGKVYVFRGEDLSAVGNPSPFLSLFLDGTGFFSNNLFGLIGTNVAINASFGFSVAATEDMNGDGLGEVIVGSPGYAAFTILPLLPVRTGTALVYYSSSLLTNTPVQLIAPSAVLLGIPTVSDGLLFGFSVDGLGDYNKDGKPDVIVGAPAGTTLLPPTNVLGGSAYIYTGTGVGVNTTHYAHLRATPSLIGTVANLFGYSVRGVRNAAAVRNGNVLIGAPSGSVLSNIVGGLRLKTGSVNVFTSTALAPNPAGELPDQSFSSPRGNSLLSILGGQNLAVSALFGASIDNMLDVNCDGINDIIVGEPLSTGVGIINSNAVGGAADIFIGNADGTYTTSLFWTLENNTNFPFGINAGSLLGYSVAGARHVRGASQGVRALVGAPGAALDFSTGIFNLGATFGTLFSFAAVDNGLGKAYLFGFDNCGLILNPDVNATFVNVPVPGNVSTNDVVPAGTAYGTPIPQPGNPGGGTITMNTDGTYTFTSTTPGIFHYQVPVCIPGQAPPCPTVDLKITVLDPPASPKPPVANTDIATTKMGIPVTINSLSNDKCSNTGCSLNPASVTVTIPPSNGTTSVDPGTGNITYTPNPGFTGKDTLSYQVCDNAATPLCATAQQIITVNATAAANSTSAADDYAYTPKSVTVNGNVKLNDTDPEGDVQTVTSQTTFVPNVGTLTLNTDGTFSFVPDPIFTGPVDFAYTICDNGIPIACASATLHILVATSGPLPVTLSNFSVSPKGCDVSVQWNFSDQVNGDFTEIERSDNGTSFLAVYKINFNGTISGFNTIKIAQLNSTGYYRLKVTDKDGRITYSEVKSVKTNCDRQQKLEVFPTLLASNTVVLFTTTDAKGISSLTLLDVYGRKLITRQVTIVKGTNRMSINSSSLSKGTYFIKIEGQDWNSETIKVIKE